MRRLSPLAMVLALSACGLFGDAPNVKVTRGGEAGPPTDAVDSDYLAELERWTADAARARLTETYDRNDVPPRYRTSRVRTEARLLRLHGQPLALIEVAYSGNPVRLSRVTGLVDGTVVTVSCTAPKGAPFALQDPEDVCGAELAAQFGEG